jgi:hypothetical protein
MKTNLSEWIGHFETHRSGWVEPDWDRLPPCELPAEKRHLLAESFAVFQVGESGGGTRLRRFVRRVMETERGLTDAGYERAIELFLAEENEHARLLERLVGYLGGRLRRRHWMNGIFRRVRTLLGLEFNLQVLLTAELIAEAYYGLLYQSIPDPVARAVCGRITRDEVGHIGFHRSFFAWRHRGRLPVETALWAVQFQVLYLVAETLVWSGHGRCLRAFGIDRRRFAGRARSVCRRFLSGVTGTGARESGGADRNGGLVGIEAGG